MSEETLDAVVVGGGLSGLIAANILERSGLSIAVLELEEDVGGRLASIALGDGLADAGAQFFTVRTPEFQNWVQQWLVEGIVYMWSTGFAYSSIEAATTSYPRYAVHGGMQALARHLAQDIADVRTQTAVTTITPVGDTWMVQDEAGDIFTTRGIVLTTPVPQSLAILRAGATRLSPRDLAVLNNIQYLPTLCALFQVEGPLHLPEPGAVQRPHAPISWIADNRQKGISHETLVTVHASSDYSQQIWPQPDSQILRTLREALKPYSDERTKVLQARLIRWPYATPHPVHDERCLQAEDLPPLFFAGDAFGGPRVEGAVLSGMAAGRALVQCFASS